MAVVLCLVLLFVARLASAQISIEPESPTWGATITIAADPHQTPHKTNRLSRSDTVFAILHTYHQGLTRRTWTPMEWDGRRFVARMILPVGCEAGQVFLATTENELSEPIKALMCRDEHGSLPPGALIEGMRQGARDKTNWKADIAADLERLADKSWVYPSIWRLQAQQEAPSRDQQLRELQELELGGARTLSAALLSSIVYGYFRAREPAKAFERLRELCQRFPDSQYTTAVGMVFAYNYVLGNQLTEYRHQLEELQAYVANSAPDNPNIRDTFHNLILNTPGVLLSTWRRVASRWTADDPADMMPYFVLAKVLADRSGDPAEIEALLTRSIELSFARRPGNTHVDGYRLRAYRLRSSVRAQKGDLPGALADAKMAETFAQRGRVSEDLDTQAELWQRVGMPNRAVAAAVQAYKEGSLKAENLLKDQYVSRAGSEQDFSEYLLDELRGNAGSGRAARPAPAFTAKTIDGEVIDSASLRGQIVVVNFWFIGCPPCRVENPQLNDVVKEFGDRVRFVAFATDEARQLKDYLRDNPFKYAIVADSKAFATSFGVHAYPTHFIIDRAGNIVWETLGGPAETVQRLRAMIYRTVASE